MTKNRISYLLFFILMAGLLLLFDRPVFILVLLLQAVLAVILFLLLSFETKRINVKIDLKKMEDSSIQCTIYNNSELSILACGFVKVSLVIENKMTGKKETENILVSIGNAKQKTEFRIPFTTYGEVSVSCENLYALDILKLFELKLKPIKENKIILYPERMNVDVISGSGFKNSQESEGMTQNKKGDDPSEIFDFREYNAGDDIRRVHWKISSKMDQLVVRESSESSHYELVILPVVGIREGTISDDEFNTALSLTESTAYKLLEKGMLFCMAVPAKNQIQLCQIKNYLDLENAITLWMNRNQEYTQVKLLQYFISSHLEKYFTRVLLISAGEFKEKLNGIENQLGVTIVNVMDDGDFVYDDSLNGIRQMSVPAIRNAEKTYHIYC